MATFHDAVRLPTHIEQGARSTVRFKTGIVALSSGAEARNKEWQRHKRKFDLAYGIDDSLELKEVIEFFYARNGRLRSFLFRDWSDYTCIDETIGEANGVLTNFQIKKTYTSGPSSYSFDIKHPSSDTIKVYKEGVEQISGWSLNTGGIIHFAAAPATGTITVTCEYDIVCRFDRDELDIDISAAYTEGTIETNKEVIDIPGIIIVEIPE